MTYYHFVAAAFCAALALSSCSDDSKSANTSTPAQAPLAIEATLANKKPVKNTVVASGTLLPFEEATLFPEIHALVTKIFVKEGRAVAKGDLLIKLFDEDILANQKRITAQLALANETVSRLSKLSKVDGVSRQELDQATLQVSVLEAELELNRVALSRTEIRAPFSGIVGLRSVSPGSYVNPSMPLLTIRQMNPLKLDFSVAERFATMIKENQMVHFSVEGDTAKYSAKVLASEKAIESETRSLRIRALVNNVGNSLIPGAFAEVSLELGGERESIFVPTQSVIPQGRKKSVVVIENGIARFAEVKTGLRMAEQVEILEGILSNDTIATTGILFLKPGAPVKITQLINN